MSEQEGAPVPVRAIGSTLWVREGRPGRSNDYDWNEKVVVEETPRSWVVGTPGVWGRGIRTKIPKKPLQQPNVAWSAADLQQMKSEYALASWMSRSAWTIGEALQGKLRKGELSHAFIRTLCVQIGHRVDELDKLLVAAGVPLPPEA